MVLSEAGASGMAIISTSVAAIPEFGPQRRNGPDGSGGRCSIPDASTPDLATNPAFRMTLGERAMAHVTRHYDAQPMPAVSSSALLKAEANAARAERLAAPMGALRLLARRSRIMEHRYCCECVVIAGKCFEMGLTWLKEVRKLPQRLATDPLHRGRIAL